MDFVQLAEELIETIKKLDKILVFIKGSPDPDVIASSFALKILGDLYKTDISIVSLSPVSLPQNEVFINKLAIPVIFPNELPKLSEYNAYAVLDHQTSFVEAIGKSLPCAIHIDHHEEAEDLVDAEFKIQSKEAGSVSTILAHIFESLDIHNNETIEAALMERAATALSYGIYSDTDYLTHARSLDKKAISYLEPYVNNNILESIKEMPFSEETVTILSKTILNQIIYKGWLISGVGFLPESYRDSIAIIADFLLSGEKVSTAIIFAIIEREDGTFHLDASCRTANKRFDLNQFIKSITPNGGARNYKGAYQVDLSYFSKCPDKTALWKVVQQSTVELLKHQRDNISSFEGVTGFFARMKKNVLNVFNQD
ncbi:MAG: hypothetical protein GY754_01330 [bacterium]|nr:hypothetical protein [bacterium]